jgi:flagellar biosynthetic protein FliR
MPVTVQPVTFSAFLITVFMISIRLAAVFLMTPIIYGGGVPPVIRALIIIGLTVVLASGLAECHPVAAATGLQPAAFILAALFEFALGALMALSILCAFAAVSLAGGLLDIQIGYGAAQVFDPISNRQTPILTSLFNQAAVVVFFVVNGHHALLRGLAYSLERFPPGQSWPVAGMLPLVLREAAGLFSLGFALAAPVIFCLFLVEIALGVISRNLPQMNMFVMGLPLKAMVGLAALALWYGGIGGAMARIYGSIYSGWSELFQAGSHAAGTYG